MKITIITPTYHTNLKFDQGPFLKKTIESVIYQEGDFDLEYIIMDGVSTDSTMDVIKKYDKLVNSNYFKPKCKNLVFKWFSQKDTGQSQALNNAFRMAQGEITNWLCSHDMLEKGALQKVKKVFEKNKGTKVVFGNCYEIDEFGNVKRFFKGKDFLLNELIRRWDKVYHNFDIMQPSVFFKKELLDELGYLDEKNHFSMDYDLWLRFRKKYPFYYINTTFSYMRIYSEAKVVKNRKEMFEQSIEISKRYWRKNYLYYSILYNTYKIFPYSALVPQIYKSVTDLSVSLKENYPRLAGLLSSLKYWLEKSKA